MGIEMSLPITIENCILLEKMNLSYEEMAGYFNTTVDYLRHFFSKNAIKHKSKCENLSSNNRILQKIIFTDSVRKSARIHKVSVGTIMKIRKEYKMKLDTKILKAFSLVVKEEKLTREISILKELLEHTTAEIIYRPENFSNNVIWGLLVEMYGDYKNELKTGWLNAFSYKHELLEILSQLLGERDND